MLVEAKVHTNFLLRKGVCFHASSVAVSGKALLFLGHATAGKSTISRLLSERYPMIADDKVWVYQKKDGGWMVRDGSDNFRAGNGSEFTIGRDQYPLLAVLRIFKANSTRIEPISPKKICKYLMDAIFEIDLQRKNEDIGRKKNWFFYSAEIAKEIEGWHLTFSKDRTIIKKIYDVFDRQ